MDEKAQAADAAAPARNKSISRWAPLTRVAKAVRESRVVVAVRDELSLASDRRYAIRVIRKDLGLTPDQGLNDLIEAVARKRGREITVVHRPIPPSEDSGYCVHGITRDTLLIDEHASPRQRGHITAHELFHLLEEDSPTCGDDEESHAVIDPRVIASVLSALPEDLVHEVLNRPVRIHGRSNYSHRAEQRAEVFASVVDQMLTLHRESSGMGAIESSFENRGSGI
jgi:hypothetical protein